MRSQPTTQQRPETFQGIDVNFVKPITIFISGIFTVGVIDCFVVIAPLCQASINVVLIGINECAWLDGLLNKRLNGGLLDIFKHMDDYLSPALDHPEDGRFLLSQGSSTALTLEPTAASPPSLSCNCFGMAFMARNEVDFIALNFPFQDYRLFFSITPVRNWLVIS